jgi:hypothetical protein
MLCPVVGAYAPQAVWVPEPRHVHWGSSNCRRPCPGRSADHSTRTQLRFMVTSSRIRYLHRLRSFFSSAFASVGARAFALALNSPEIEARDN